MKALKNDCTIYVAQILEDINNCYSDSTPTNNQLMELYSFIGKNICEQGEKAFVVYLAEVLSEQVPQLKGFSPRNLRRMRDFYITYQYEPQMTKKAQTLSWTQNTVILECCESNEQRSFYLHFAKENNLSKLALMKALKEEIFEQAQEEKINAKAEADCGIVVADLCDAEDSNSTQHSKNDCKAFVPRCEPFLQGICVSKISNKAFRHMHCLKIDLLHHKVTYYEKAILSIRSSIERLRQKLQYTPPPPGIAERNKIPILLLT